MLRLWSKKRPRRPATGRLLLVMALVAGHCCMVTLPSHAAAQPSAHASHVSSHVSHAGHGPAVTAVMQSSETLSAPRMLPCGDAPYLAAERTKKTAARQLAVSPGNSFDDSFDGSPDAFATPLVVLAEWQVSDLRTENLAERRDAFLLPPRHLRAGLQILRI